jgi:hypothetical protein
LALATRESVESNSIGTNREHQQAGNFLPAIMMDDAEEGLGYWVDLAAAG